MKDKLAKGLLVFFVVFSLRIELGLKGSNELSRLMIGSLRSLLLRVRGAVGMLD